MKHVAVKLKTHKQRTEESLILSEIKNLKNRFDYLNRCSDELLRAEKTSLIIDQSVTLISLLVYDEDKLEDYARDQALIKYLRSGFFKRNFFQFTELICMKMWLKHKLFE